MTKRFFIALLFLSTGAIASDQTLPVSVVEEAPYWTDPEAAAAADEKFRKAAEMGKSQFKVGSPRELNRLLDEAAMAGHPDAAGMLCLINSNEMGGIAFFRQAYVWCRITEHSFAAKDPAKAADARRSLDYVIGRLGEHLADAQENEQYVLRRITGRASSP